MICPKCGSGNVTVQAIVETELKKKKPGFFWWFFIGWWWVPIKWIFFTVPALIVKIFCPKDYYTKSKIKKMAICHNCGNDWECK